MRRVGPPAVAGALRVLMHPLPERSDANPYVSLLAESLRRQGAVVTRYSTREAVLGRHDVIHLHWPAACLGVPSATRATLRACRLLTGLTLAKARGSRVVWTAHNLAEHDRQHPWLARAFWFAFVRLVDGWLTLSAAGGEQVKLNHARLRRRPSWLTPHGHYRSVVGQLPARSEARRRLGLPDVRTIAFVGQMRPYKGIEDLIRAFRSVSDPRLRLFIGGACPDDQLAARLLSLVQGDPRIILRVGHLDEPELATVLAAADCLVAPYTRVFNSGSAYMALTVGRRILLPATPVMRELRSVAGEEWIRLFDGQLSGAALVAALDEPPAECSVPDLGWADWERVSAMTENAYRSVCLLAA